MNMTFNETVDRISIQKEALGYYTIVGHKKIENIWLDPFVNQHDLSIWAQMRNKYEADMDEYFQLLDEINQKN